jgi:hypothetical protein
MRRRFLAAWGCGLAALFAASSPSAQIFKCPVNGVQVYQQSPCAGLGESGGSLMIRANGERVSAAPAPSGPPPPRVLGKTRLPTPKPGNKP